MTAFISRNVPDPGSWEEEWLDVASRRMREGAEILDAALRGESTDRNPVEVLRTTALAVARAYNALTTPADER